MLLSSTICFDPVIQDSFAIKRLEEYSLFDHLPARLRYHKICLIEDGQGHIQIDDARYQLDKYQLILMAKGQVQAFETGAFMIGYEMLFGDCFWEKAPASASNCKAFLFNNAEANQQLAIAPTDLMELQPLFQSLLTESTKPNYSNKLDTLAAYLKIIMIKVANINASLHKGFDDEDKQLYRRYIELVSNQYKSSHEVSAFAEQLAVTARRLTEVCRRSSGKGAKEIINGQLMAEAKRSLLFSAMPVKEIAYDLNFASPEQFSHFFKRSAGISPNDYRDAYVISDR